MNLLVDKNTGAILAEHHGTPRWFNDRVGPLQLSGDAIWLPVPVNCPGEFARVVLTPSPHVEVDQPALDAKAAKNAEEKAKKDAIKAIDFTKKLSDDEIDLVLRDYLARGGN